MIVFLKQYLQWRKLRRDLYSKWTERYSRVAVQLEIERLQKEIFIIDAEIDEKSVAQSLLMESLKDAKTRLRAIEDYV